MTLTLDYPSTAVGHTATPPGRDHLLLSLLGVGGATLLVAFLVSMVCVIANATATHTPKLTRTIHAVHHTSPVVTVKTAPALAVATPPAVPAPAAPVAAPYFMYDSTIVADIPSGAPIATYADGPYAVPQVVGHPVTWIDVNGSDPAANVLDVEPSDATPAGSATWAYARLTAYPNATAVIYTMKSDWAAVQTSISTLPAAMQSHVQYWIADPTGVPHIVPGASATQYYWGHGYDLSEVAPNFDQS